MDKVQKTSGSQSFAYIYCFEERRTYHTLLVWWYFLTAINILYDISTHIFRVTSRIVIVCSRSEELLGPLYNGVQQEAWRSNCLNSIFLGTVKKHVLNIFIRIAFGFNWTAEMC
jgi:hypothetical protein